MGRHVPQFFSMFFICFRWVETQPPTSKSNYSSIKQLWDRHMLAICWAFTWGPWFWGRNPASYMGIYNNKDPILNNQYFMERCFFSLAEKWVACPKTPSRRTVAGIFLFWHVFFQNKNTSFDWMTSPLRKWVKRHSRRLTARCFLLFLNNSRRGWEEDSKNVSNG